jgi:hypothetical protein
VTTTQSPQKPTTAQTKAALQPQVNSVKQPNAETKPATTPATNTDSVVSQLLAILSDAQDTSLKVTPVDLVKKVSDYLDRVDPQSQSPAATGSNSNSATPNPQNVTTKGATAQQTLLNLQEKVGKELKQGQPKASPAEQFAINNDGSNTVKYKNQSSGGTSEQGTVATQQSQMQVATKAALTVGSNIVARGNTIIETQPGKGDASGLVLDYAANRDAFVGHPEILKRTGLQLPGMITVQGWNVTEKSTVGASVTMSIATPSDPNKVINVPDWGAVKMSDPIFPGCVYTWGDATMGGERVPTKPIMQQIAAIAQELQILTEKVMGKSGKFKINSWYRTPEANRIAGGASQSRHLVGDAVDFHYDTHGTEAALYRSLEPTWKGGLALCPGSFCHIDLGARGRWTY